MRGLCVLYGIFYKITTEWTFAERTCLSRIKWLNYKTQWWEPFGQEVIMSCSRVNSSC